jgi:hypothetical protein
MTKEHAAQLLGLNANASADEVTRKYQELYTDYQIRLTNAPTPNLKKTYQKNLQELEEACRTLAPGIRVDSAEDLPTASPILNVMTPAPPRARVETALPGDAKAAAASQEQPSSKLLLPSLILSAVLAAAAVFLGLQWYSSQTQEQALQQALEVERGKLARLARYEALLKNGRLSVCNHSPGPISINALGVVYLDSAGALQVFNSAFYDYKTWSLRPGGRERLELVRGAGTVWDGSVIAYTMILGYGGREIFFSGLWSDVEGDCLKLALGE